jgi:hypothetical protein
MTETPTTATGPAGAPAQAACQNCGAPLLGDHCYACGQPVKGLVRHFGSILGDFFDSVLNIDSRVFRTLWPLFSRPGRLSLEYFAGHRVRYVSPVRLFVFLSIVTFFVAQLALDFSGKVDAGGGDDDFSKATSVEQVQQRRDAALAELEQARQDAGDTPGVGVGLDVAATAIRERAAARIVELRTAQSAGKPPPPASAEDDGALVLNGTPWDPAHNPIAVGWLPGFANRWLNDQAGHAKDNIKRLQQDPNLFKDAVLSSVPSTLFVLLPVFAAMLKLAYALKRRLYMEHLIVALHSHAFLCLSLLLMLLLYAIEDALGAGAGALKSLLDLVEAALWIWMPLYLLLMQKRVYGQGWTMTLLKYFALGLCYIVLLSFGAVATMLAGLVWM